MHWGCGRHVAQCDACGMYSYVDKEYWPWTNVSIYSSLFCCRCTQERCVDASSAGDGTTMLALCCGRLSMLPMCSDDIQQLLCLVVSRLASSCATCGRVRVCSGPVQSSRTGRPPNVPQDGSIYRVWGTSIHSCATALPESYVICYTHHAQWNNTNSAEG